ncbi:MAG: ATP-binding protein, partial [Alphaproteobacteria bacterium]
AEQAKKELKSAEDVLPRVARECFKWLLCPAQDTPTAKPIVETVSLNTSGASLGAEMERVCLDNEWVIATWSPIHLRSKLQELYWKDGKTATKAADFWEDTLRYLYLPRLKNRDVIAQAIVKGAGTKDFFGTAYGEHDGKFDGFKYGDANVQFDDTLLLIASECATAYAEKMQASAVASVAPADAAIQVSPTSPLPTSGIPSITPTELKVTPESKAKSFHGSIEIAPATAKMKLLQVAEEIISALSEDPNAEIKVRLEIEADFPEGALDHLKRTISENAKTLGFRINEWE